MDVVTLCLRHIWDLLIASLQDLLKNMGKYGKGSTALITAGILGLVGAIIVGILIWLAILKW